MRRHATTSPLGSKCSDPSACAVSSTSAPASTLCARATYRRCSIGCTMPTVLLAVGTGATQPRCRPMTGWMGRAGSTWLRLLAVADTSSEHKLPTDLTLTPLDVRSGGLGDGRPLSEWLTTFHLASVVLDPYTN